MATGHADMVLLLPGRMCVMRNRLDVIADLHDLIDGEDDELGVLLGEAIEHLEATQQAFELLGGD